MSGSCGSGMLRGTLQWPSVIQLSYVYWCCSHSTIYHSANFFGNDLPSFFFQFQCVACVKGDIAMLVWQQLGNEWSCILWWCVWQAHLVIVGATKEQLEYQLYAVQTWPQESKYFIHMCTSVKCQCGSNVIKCPAESTFTLYNLATITLICLLL